MTDPEYPIVTPEQEKEYANQLARAEAARNELRILAMSPESIRRRAKRRLIKLVIGYAGLVLACWYLGYVVYRFWH